MSRQTRIENMIFAIGMPFILGTICAIAVGATYNRGKEKYIQCKKELSEVKQNKLDEITKAANSCGRRMP